MQRERAQLAAAATDELFLNVHPDEWDELATALGAPKDVLERGRRITRAEAVRNPLRYRWRGPHFQKEMLKFGTGQSIESAVFTAEMCGAYLLFGDGAGKLDYDIAVQSGIHQEPGLRDLTRLSRAFSELELQFLNAVDLDLVLSLRLDGKVSSFRNFLLKVWEEVGSCESTSANHYQMFVDELQSQYAMYREEWKDIDRALVRNFARAALGAGIATLSGTLGFEVGLGGLAAFEIKELFEAQARRQRHRRLPLGVFLQLAERSRK